MAAQADFASELADVVPTARMQPLNDPEPVRRLANAVNISSMRSPDITVIRAYPFMHKKNITHVRA